MKCLHKLYTIKSVSDAPLESGKSGLNELDTITDFCAYIRAKESLFRQVEDFVLSGGEEDLLSYYLKNGRTFDAFKGYTCIMFEGDSWNDFERHPQYMAKKEADRISYAWDAMIDRAHTADNPQYEHVARELARPSRVERRFLSKAFMEAQMIADESNRTYRRFVFTDELVYCFLFQDDPEPRQDRRNHLAAMCHVARSKEKRKKIIGIATEEKLRPSCSCDFVLVEVHDWSDEDQKLLEHLETYGDILKSPKKSIVHEDEYPNTDG